MKKLVYISGPISSNSEETSKAYLKSAMGAAAYVVSIGHLPICPHLSITLNDYFISDCGFSLPYSEWLLIDFHLIKICYCVYRISTEIESPGCSIEELYADSLGIRVFNSPTELEKYLNGER